jgi:hypothetical protein
MAAREGAHLPNPVPESGDETGPKLTKNPLKPPRNAEARMLSGLKLDWKTKDSGLGPTAPVRWY